MTTEESRPEVRLEAYASGSATIYVAAGSQYIAGGDLHLHYEDGAHRVRPDPDPVDECPYPGMSAFGPEQAQWYFGRDALRARLTDRLDECLERGGALAVVAASGAGKSSLLRAGLVPDLALGALPGSRHWPCLVFTPTAAPMAALTTQLAVLTDSTPGRIAEQLDSGPDELARHLRAALAERKAGRLVVVVDQAEELFTLVTDERERQRFVTALERLARPDGPALVVYGLRADFYGHCTRYRPLREALKHRQVLVEPMDRTELRQAIVSPAEALGVEVAEGLVELLLTDLGTEEGYEPGRLPHLAHALRQTWRRLQGDRTLTLSAYLATGGIRGAVARSAEDVHSGLDDRGRQAAQVMFRRLVRIGEGTDDTRRPLPVEQLTEGIDPAVAEAVLTGFTERRLLTRQRETVVITHEALLRAWPLLRHWVDAHRADNLLRQQLEEDAAAWAGKDRDRAHLYRGSRLADARTWADRTDRDGLGPTAADFLDASLRLARRTTALFRGAVATLVVLTLLAVVGAVTAQSQSTRADTQRTEAEKQTRLAVGRALRAQAENLRDSDPRTSLQLSLTAQRVDPTPEGGHGLLTTLQQTRFDGASPDGVLGRADGIATFLRSGTLLASSAYRAKSVDLWDTADPVRPRRLATLADFPEPVAHVSASPDGRLLAVVTSDLGSQAVHELSLWDLTDRERPRRLPFRAGADKVTDAAFSPDGRTLAVVAGGADGTLTLWDLGDPASPRRLSEPTAATDADTVRFSPDGRTLVTAAELRKTDFSFDGNSITHYSGWQLWNVQDLRRPRAVFRELGFQGPLTVSPTAPVLAVGIGARLALWDFTDPAAPRRIAVLEHPTRVTGAAFRPDGRGILTASEGGRAQLWELTDPARPAGPTRIPCPADLAGFAFGADGRHVVTVDSPSLLPGSISRWRVTPRTAPGLAATFPSGDPNPEGTAFSPDGHRLAVGGFGGDIHRWDVTDPARPRELPPLRSQSAQPVQTVAFNRDGTALAAGTIADANSDHGEIVLWDVTDTDRPQRRAVLATPTGVTSLAFSPRTATLAASGKTNGAGNTWVALWDTGTPVPTRSYLHESLNQLLHDTEDPKPLAVPFIVAATPTAFSPDGRLLALSGSLWDVSDPSAPVRVRHANLPADDRRWPRPSLSGMDRAAFSPDGHRLAEAGRGSDEEVSLWPADQAVGAHPLGSVPARNSVQVGYHPGGHLLVTAEKHGAVRLWDVTDPALPVLAVTLEQTAQDVRFSPDGRTLMLLPEEGGAVQLWDLGDLPTTVTNTTGLDCRLVGTGLAEQVWTKTYASGLPYEQTCPR